MNELGDNIVLDLTDLIYDEKYHQLKSHSLLDNAKKSRRIYVKNNNIHNNEAISKMKRIQGMEKLSKEVKIYKERKLISSGKDVLKEKIRHGEKKERGKIKENGKKLDVDYNNFFQGSISEFLLDEEITKKPDKGVIPPQEEDDFIIPKKVDEVKNKNNFFVKLKHSHSSDKGEGEDKLKKPKEDNILRDSKKGQRDPKELKESKEYKESKNINHNHKKKEEKDHYKDRDKDAKKHEKTDKHKNRLHYLINDSNQNKDKKIRDLSFSSSDQNGKESKHLSNSLNTVQSPLQYLERHDKVESEKQNKEHISDKNNMPNEKKISSNSSLNSLLLQSSSNDNNPLTLTFQKSNSIPKIKKIDPKFSEELEKFKKRLSFIFSKSLEQNNSEKLNTDNLFSPPEPIDTESDSEKVKTSEKSITLNPFQTFYKNSFEDSQLQRHLFINPNLRLNYLKKFPKNKRLINKDTLFNIVNNEVCQVVGKFKQANTIQTESLLNNSDSSTKSTKSSSQMEKDIYFVLLSKDKENKLNSQYIFSLENTLKLKLNQKKIKTQIINEMSIDMGVVNSSQY